MRPTFVARPNRWLFSVYTQTMDTQIKYLKQSSITHVWAVLLYILITAYLLFTASAATAQDSVNQAITISNVKVLGEAPSMSMGSVYQSASCSLTNGADDILHVRAGSGAQKTLNPDDIINVPCRYIPLSTEQYNSQNELMISSATATQGVSLIYDQDAKSAKLYSSGG